MFLGRSSGLAGVRFTARGRNAVLSGRIEARGEQQLGHSDTGRRRAARRTKGRRRRWGYAKRPGRWWRHHGEQGWRRWNVSAPGWWRRNGRGPRTAGVDRPRARPAPEGEGESGRTRCRERARWERLGGWGARRGLPPPPPLLGDPATRKVARLFKEARAAHSDPSLPPAPRFHRSRQASPIGGRPVSNSAVCERLRPGHPRRMR